MGPRHRIASASRTMSHVVEASRPSRVGKIIPAIAVFLTLLVAPFQPLTPLAHAQQLTLENLDGAPFPDRLAFNRIGRLSNPPANGVHDLATLRLHNTGSAPLRINRLNFEGRFRRASIPSLPVTIPPSGSLDLMVRFTASRNPSVHTGTLTIRSNDPVNPSMVVDLAGIWQRASESGEPTLEQIVERTFGYGTDILFTNQIINNQGRIELVGEEVFAPYWKRADATEPVTIRQLAAFHTYPDAMRVAWHFKNSGSVKRIFTHDEQDAQSVLPRRSGTSAIAYGEFSPSLSTDGGVFGWRVGPEWSDPARNNKTNDDCSSGPSTCGHHVRFWPVRDQAGAVVPNTYLMTMDISGINFDFNDNVYIVSNIVPESSGLFAASSAEHSELIEAANETPETFALEGNYPNPFNPRTTIRYELAQDVHVELEVFDLVGRRVATLVEGPQAAGRHEVVFDAGTLPSGMYIYRLRAGSFILTRKMVLMK